MSNQVLEAISNRRSNRSYSSEPLTQEQLDALIKAALESPTGRNAQSWHFTVVRNKDLLTQINGEFLQNLGEPGGKRDVFFGAPTVIFISADTQNKWGQVDGGIAVQNIALAAHSLGLGSVIVGGVSLVFSGEKGAEFEKRLKFPPDNKFIIAIAVGKATDAKEAHEILPDKVSYVD